MDPNSSITIMDGEWSMEGVVRQLTKEGAEEPFYVMDLGEVVKRYEYWTKLMPRVVPFYAVKCNNDEILVRTLAMLGAGFDCASQQEIELVTRLGVKPELLLRIRCDATSAQVSLGAKFGCDPVTEAPFLLRTARELDLEVIGVSFHVGSGVKESEAYARGVKNCANLFKLGGALGFHMRLVDIGGGYPGDDLPAMFEISKVINAALETHFPDDSVSVIAEPGRYFACSAYTLAACIIAKREVVNIDGRHTMYYMSAGIYGSLLHRTLHNMEFKQQLVNPTGTERQSCSLWGPTCDSLDCVVPSTTLESVPVGTWLYFRNVGAYTRSVATTFNGFQKPKLQCVIVNRDVWETIKYSELFMNEEFESRSLSPCSETSEWSLSIR